MAVDGIATGILEKLSSVVIDEITLLWDFKDELKNLHNTLNMILAVMKDAEEKQASDAEVRLWMEELKAIAYDAEDILDDYSYEVIRWKREKEEQDNSTFFNKVCNFCSSSSKSFVCSWNLAHQIKEINEGFNKIVKRKNDLGLQRIYVGSSSSSSHTMMMINRETYSGVAANWKIVGREKDQSTIIKMLLEEENSSNQSGGSKHVSVIPIVGMGGLGKTTMAQLVYNDEAVKRHFDIKVWICVSDPFDFNKLSKNIWKSLDKEAICDDAATKENIVRGFQKHLSGKKFLLVLDDVWNKNFRVWHELKSALKVGAEGSKILVTTRSIEVAKLVHDKFPHYELGILNGNDSWSLFKEITFGSGVGAVESLKLVEIGKEMVRRCGGLPLAVIFLGSLMRSKKKEVEWKIIRDTKIWHEYKEGENSTNEILPSLRLSYDNLSSHLKRCFSYCCLFPKDSIIKREKLIRLWMAEGFLIESPEENAMSMEEIGNKYFHHLLCNFFFQDAEKDEDGDIATCKMHDLVHDLARSVVGKNECLIVDSDNDIGLISEATRRLNLLVNLHDKEMLPKFLEAWKKAKKLRTVFVHQQIISFDIGNAFKENKKLRVLDLSESRVYSSSSSIGGLKHLRYLDNNVLDLSVFGACFPKGIGRLSFLQTLSEFKVGDKKKNKNAGGIEELEGLNLLRGDLWIIHLENVTSGKAACRVNLKKKKNLRGLKLYWSRSESEDDGINNHEAVLEGLQPHPNLKTLEIWGFDGSKLPRWIQEDSSSCLPNLVELTLYDCIYIEQVAGFGALPSLRSLRLKSMEKVECIGNELYYSAAAAAGSAGSGSSSSRTSVAFPSLKKLTLEFMPSLKEWVLPPPLSTTGATTYCFPLLEEIHIIECPHLITITPTTTIFPSLKVLNLVYTDGRAVETLVTNNLNSLTSLRLCLITNLITLPRQGLMENNNTLLSLHIERCDEFEGFFPPNKDDDDEDQEGGGQQQQLQQVVSSSTSSSSSLQSLKLEDCPALRLYPNIRSLTSLRKLVIRCCKISKSLQDELTCLSSSLEHLEHVFLKIKTATEEEEEEEEVVVFEWRKSSSFKEKE